MKKLICILLATLCFSLLYSLDWPLLLSSDTKKDIPIAATFGTNQGGRPLLGIVFETPELPVYASDSGDIVFSFDPQSNANVLQSGLGSFVAINHNKDITSVYAHLKTGSVAGAKTKADKGEIIAFSGNTGSAKKSNLYFILFDQMRKRYVNPSMFISKFTDNKNPLIKTIYLVKGTNEYNLAQTRLTKQGSWDVVAEIEDSETASWAEGNIAPYKISLLLNGAIKAQNNFDSIHEKDGVLILFPKNEVPYTSAFLKDGRIKLGTVQFLRGKSNLEIIVQDFAGNERSVSIPIFVE